MKIAIAGSGALGCGFGAKIFKNGYDVTLIDGWDQQVEAIRNNGLNIDINSEQYNFNIPILRTNELMSNQKFDVIFLFTKSMQLHDMLNIIKENLHERTIVVNTMNGLKHEDTMAKYIPVENIVRGITTWTAGMSSPGHTHLLGDGPVEIGNIVSEGEDNLNKIIDLLNASGLKGVKSTDIHWAIWRKICVNATANALCTVLDCNLKTLNDSLYGQNLMRQLVEEIAEAAKIDDVYLDVEETLEYLNDVNINVGPHYPSMHQDLISNNRLTEIDFINGAVAQIGDEINISTPVNHFITNLIHAKEDILEAK